MLSGFQNHLAKLAELVELLGYIVTSLAIASQIPLVTGV
jgi:hypothetical protein